MPSVEQILSGLKHVTVAWGTVAIFWHAYFAAIALALLFGLRPPKRLAGGRAEMRLIENEKMV